MPGSLVADNLKKTYILPSPGEKRGVKVPAGFARDKPMSPLIRFFQHYDKRFLMPRSWN